MVTVKNNKNTNVISMHTNLRMTDYLTSLKNFNNITTLFTLPSNLDTAWYMTLNKLQCEPFELCQSKLGLAQQDEVGWLKLA